MGQFGAVRPLGRPAGGACRTAEHLHPYPQPHLRRRQDLSRPSQQRAKALRRYKYQGDSIAWSTPKRCRGHRCLVRELRFLSSGADKWRRSWTSALPMATGGACPGKRSFFTFSLTAGITEGMSVRCSSRSRSRRHVICTPSFCTRVSPPEGEPDPRSGAGRASNSRRRACECGNGAMPTASRSPP